MRPEVVSGSHSGRIVWADRRRGGSQPPAPTRDSTRSTSIPPGRTTWYAIATRPVLGWIPMAGSMAFRPEVTADGAVQARPSVEVDTTTLFDAHPELKRQSCHVTQPRPAGSPSAEGRGKK